MASFRFCETCLLHIKPCVVNKSAIFPFLGGKWIVSGLALIFSQSRKKPRETNRAAAVLKPSSVEDERADHILCSGS